MNGYRKQVEIRWSDLDPNFHLRHSAYYDFGAFLRMSFLTEEGLTPHVMQQEKLGPIIFREECVFKREIHFHDNVEITLELAKSTADMGRWAIRHEIWKNSEVLSAIITVEGAWIDTHQRKLALPTPLFTGAFSRMPRSADFTWTEKTRS